MQETPVRDKCASLPPFIQIPSNLLAYVRSCRLTGTEYALWLILYELAPTGDRYINIPSPRDLAQELRVDIRTLQRAAKRLEDLGLFTFEIQSWKARNSKAFSQTVPPDEHFAPNPLPDAPSSPSSLLPDYSFSKEIQMTTERSRCQKNNQIDRPPEPTQHQGSSDFSTGDDVPEQKFKFKKETDLVSNSLSVLNTKETSGTTFDAIVRSVQTAGFEANAAIRATLSNLYHTLEPSALEAHISNAISAVKEQIRKGNLRKPTPEPLLNAALKRRFTSNEGKKKAKRKKQRTAQPAEVAQNTQDAQIDLVQLSLSIDQAIHRGDRLFALQKLQQLWHSGRRTDIRIMIECHPSWGFDWTNDGPMEGNAEGSDV